MALLEMFTMFQKILACSTRNYTITLQGDATLSEIKISWCAVCGQCQGTVQEVRKHLIEKHYEWVKLHLFLLHNVRYLQVRHRRFPIQSPATLSCPILLFEV